MSTQPGAEGSPTDGGTASEGLELRIEEAKRRLQAAASTAGEAERRTEAEIRALEADLERVRTDAEAKIEALRLEHAEELQREREGRERAIETAEERLGEIEAQAEAAEERVAAAEERAARAQREVSDEQARARESAAAWLRGQLARSSRRGD